MSMAEKLTTIAENVPKVYEAGQKSEYDRFWDEFQNYGNRKDYWYAFAGTPSWLLKIYGGVPKYDIVLKDTTTTSRCCYGMFMAFNRDRTLGEQADMTEICKHIDFSGCNQAVSVFHNAKAKNITCDFSNCITLSNTFNCSDGGVIDYINLKVTEKCTSFNGAFSYCTQLTELRFIEGSTVAANLDLQRSTLLTYESLMNVINVLKDYSESGTTHTLTLGTTNLSKLTDAEKAIATEKGWTLA